MSTELRRIALLAALMLGLGACAESPALVRSNDLEAMRARLDQLERRDVQSQLEIARLHKQIADLQAELARAREPSEGAAPGAPSTAADGSAAPATEVTPEPRPTTSIEESNLADEPAPAAPSAAASAGQAVTEAYDAALRLLRDGRPADSEHALRTFADRYPSSDLADNAWFWIGESLRVRGDLAGALEAYRTAIDRYPDGNKIPDTLLELGAVLDLEGRRDAAREAWAELVRRYPDTAAAESARGRLSQP